MVEKKTQVLIVDDEPTVCYLLNEELTDRGYLCTLAFDGNDALSKLATQGFDAVLLDIRLPRMSGMEVLRKIRADHHDTIVIMITAVNDADTAVQAMKLGASDYIVKPFDLPKLCTTIYTLMEVKKHSLDRTDCQILPYLGGKGEDKPAIAGSFSEMNAIARGVEAKLDLLDNHSKIVTQRTVDIARRFGIPEREIQRWVAARVALDSQRNRAIRSLLNKLQDSPLTQYIMGMTEPHVYTPGFEQSQN